MKCQNTAGLGMLTVGKSALAVGSRVGRLARAEQARMNAIVCVLQALGHWHFCGFLAAMGCFLEVAVPGRGGAVIGEHCIY